MLGILCPHWAGAGKRQITGINTPISGFPGSRAPEIVRPLGPGPTLSDVFAAGPSRPKERGRGKLFYGPAPTLAPLRILKSDSGRPRPPRLAGPRQVPVVSQPATFPTGGQAKSGAK